MFSIYPKNLFDFFPCSAVYRRIMLLFAYRFLSFLAAPFLVVLTRLRLVYGREERGHTRERYGYAHVARPDGPVVWIHAASNGEMRSALPLVRALLDRNPALHVLVTTVTVTAARLARGTHIDRLIHQFVPWDSPQWVQRFIAHWRPDAVLWVESELWPNLLEAVKSRGIPLAMINGRLSARSAARWGHAPQTIRHILSLFDVCLAQSDSDAARLAALGAPAPAAIGNMKYAGAPLPYDPAQLDALRASIGSRPCVLFASTHAGEEEIAARVYTQLASRHAGLLGIILPRHPARGAAIAAQLRGDGLQVAVRSARDSITPATQVYLADTLGEPGLFYRLCRIVYLGNSLVPVPGGGHNPIEPAQCGCAIVYGPHMWNFGEIDTALRAAHAAVMVDDEAGLTASFARLLDDAAERDRMAQAARAFVDAQNGVLDTVLARLRPVLERGKIAV